MDLKDAQWEAIREFVPGPELERTTEKGRRPWRDPRDVLHGIPIEMDRTRTAPATRSPPAGHRAGCASNHIQSSSFE
jgi:hypothetical protein